MLVVSKLSITNAAIIAIANISIYAHLARKLTILIVALIKYNV